MDAADGIKSAKKKQKKKSFAKKAAAKSSADGSEETASPPPVWASDDTSADEDSAESAAHGRVASERTTEEQAREQHRESQMFTGIACPKVSEELGDDGADDRPVQEAQARTKRQQTTRTWPPNLDGKTVFFQLKDWDDQVLSCRTWV